MVEYYLLRRGHRGSVCRGVVTRLAIIGARSSGPIRMSVTALAIFGGNVALLVAVAARLPLLHPATLWAAVWSLASTLYLLHLLPYHDPDPLTAVVALAGSVTFIVGTLVGERLFARRLGADRSTAGDREGDADRALAVATVLVAALAAIMLGAFLLQVAATYGLRASVVASADVRRAIGDGFAGATIKFVYPALGGAALGGLAAARLSATRWRWLAVAAACTLSTYFSTGRSTMLIAGAAGAVAFALGSSTRPSNGMVLKGAALLTVGTLLAFLGVGQLLGKTFANSEIATMDTSFTRHELLRPLALPYHYVSTPLAALDEQVGVTGTWGRAQGCATGREVCSILARAGLDVHPEPRLRPFTARPLTWNTYTGLDFPLIDLGTGLFWIITLLTGVGVGALWHAAQSRSATGIVVYALVATAILYSSVQYNFLAPHIVGAAVIVSAALLAGRYIAARLDASSSEEAVV